MLKPLLLESSLNIGSKKENNIAKEINVFFKPKVIISLKYIRNIDTSSIAAMLPFEDTDAVIRGIAKYI